MATVYLQGIGCANPKHPNGFAEGPDASALIRFVEAWRCTFCGGPNAMTGAPTALDRPDSDDAPGRVFGL